MQTAMDGNSNGWHEMIILCCVCCFCFVTSVFAAFGVRTLQLGFCFVASVFAALAHAGTQGPSVWKHSASKAAEAAKASAHMYEISECLGNLPSFQHFANLDHNK